METIITGAAFGASLVASGAYQPHLMALQFSLQKWNLFQTFLTATASSALLVELFRQLGYAVPQPRAWSSIGLLSALDGNIFGGLFLGAGMALSSSCPSIALPQVALRSPPADAILVGGSLGGVFWSAILRPWIERRKRRSSSRRPQPPKTLASAVGMGRTTTFLLYEAALVGAVGVMAAKTPTSWSPISPVTGGLIIGGAQLVSLLLRGSLLGVSTWYEQIGDWAVYVLSSTQRKGSRPRYRPDTTAMLFAGAVGAGAWLLAQRRPDLASAPYFTRGGETGLARALAGGFLMSVGSRMAGGCAAGHGISGMALMSLSSLVTMAAAFAAAIGVSKLEI